MKGAGAMTAATAMNAALPAGHRERLMQFAREVSFEAGARLFEEGRHADRFWIVRRQAERLPNPAARPLRPSRQWRSGMTAVTRHRRRSEEENAAGPRRRTWTTAPTV
jgi:hypothetical protein